MTATPFMTDIRRAMWSAIENFESTRNTFQQKFKEDREIASMLFGTMGSCQFPAISILPLSMNPRTVATQLQQWAIGFEIKIWVCQESYSQAEDLIERAIRAISAAKPEGDSATYLRKARCGEITQQGPITIRPSTIGSKEQQIPCLLATAVLTPKFSVNPFV